jgi:large subunit ribosomal protein L29
MKASEIRDMTADELRRKVADLKQELFNLRFQLEVGQLENKARIRQTKQDIARLMTVIRETNPKPQPAKA